MDLTEYHQKYINMPQDWVEFGLRAKDAQLKQVFEEINWQPAADAVKIAVLGCADKRFVAGHKQLFKKFLKKEVEVTTFDITTEHLSGAENVVEHDCTKPFPGASFDLIFSHILLKFMPADSQWLVLENSFNALAPGGVALHFMDVQGQTVPTSMIAEGFFQIPLAEFKNRLTEKAIKFQSCIVKSKAEQNRDLECLALFK